MNGAIRNWRRSFPIPSVITNQPEFRKLSREHSDLAGLVDAYRRYRKILAEIDGNRELLADPDMKEMAEEELPFPRSR